MVVEPDLDERAWIWVSQVNLTKNLEGLGRRLLRIRDHPVDDLQPVDISLVLYGAAVGIEQRGSQEEEEGEVQ